MTDMADIRLRLSVSVSAKKELSMDRIQNSRNFARKQNDVGYTKETPIVLVNQLRDASCLRQQLILPFFKK